MNLPRAVRVFLGLIALKLFVVFFVFFIDLLLAPILCVSIFSKTVIFKIGIN
jgi:hypothetical protein